MTNYDGLINESLLPTQMRLLIKCIGLPETIALLKAKGGTTIRIPLSADNCIQFDDILQPESIVKLTANLGGKVMELPKYDKIGTQLRDIAIRAARNNTPANKLAQDFGLSRRMIIYICGDTTVDKRQTRLFD